MKYLKIFLFTKEIIDSYESWDSALRGVMGVMQEKNASTPLDLLRVAVLSVMFAPMMIRIGSSLSNSPALKQLRT